MFCHSLLFYDLHLRGNIWNEIIINCFWMLFLIIRSFFLIWVYDVEFENADKLNYYPQILSCLSNKNSRSGTVHAAWIESCHLLYVDNYFKYEFIPVNDLRKVLLVSPSYLVITIESVLHISISQSWILSKWCHLYLHVQKRFEYKKATPGMIHAEKMENFHQSYSNTFLIWDGEQLVKKCLWQDSHACSSQVTTRLVLQSPLSWFRCFQSNLHMNKIFDYQLVKIICWRCCQYIENLAAQNVIKFQRIYIGVNTSSLRFPNVGWAKINPVKNHHNFFYAFWALWNWNKTSTLHQKWKIHAQKNIFPKVWLFWGIFWHILTCCMSVSVLKNFEMLWQSKIPTELELM